MAELINELDSLDKGRIKINESIKDANIAKIDSAEALGNSENTQQQLDTIVINGDSSVEAAQARVDRNNQEYATLKQRLDAEQQKVDSVDGLDTEVQQLSDDVDELRNRKSIVVSDVEPENVDIWFQVVE